MTLEAIQALSDDDLNRKVAEHLGSEFDWCSDLNACHEMEETLSCDAREGYAKTQRWAYEINLRKLVPASIVSWPSIHATARQRCEAFVWVMEGMK